MKRRDFLRLSALIGPVTAFLATPPAVAYPRSSRQVKPFVLDELTISQLQELMTSGRFSAVGLVKKYLSRIEEIDRRGPALNAVIEPNPDALTIAASLDQERKTKGPRGPLHGISVLIKDNIDTHDRMTTTAGSLALEGYIPSRDSFLADRLRAAGVGILGKTKPTGSADFPCRPPLPASTHPPRPNPPP